MRLSAKVILNFSSVNSFDYGNQWTIRAGDPNTIYFQLIDLDRNGLRYIPGVGVSNQPVSIMVTFPSIDDNQVLNITATQDTSDGSIFKAIINPNQKPNSGNVRFSITEGSNIRRFSVINMISVEYVDSEGQC